VSIGHETKKNCRLNITSYALNILHQSIWHSKKLFYVQSVLQDISILEMYAKDAFMKLGIFLERSFNIGS